MTQAEEWLDNEDTGCREGRLARLDWLTSITPIDKYWVFNGAPITKYLFEEARYCFVYRQFLASIVLGFAFIEHTLAALLFAAGRDDLERANVTLLLKEALNLGWLTQSEFDNLNDTKRTRNPITHFRKPLDEESIEFRAYSSEEQHYSIIEQDAKNVMTVVFHLLNNMAL